MLFADISELKNFVGGGANISLELSSILPTMEEAAWNHVIPILGEEQWQDLYDNFDSPDADQTALLPYVQKPLAMLSLHEYAKIGNIQFGESGIYRVETDMHKSAYKYQENQYKEYMLHQGYEALERMQKFLDNNDDTYTVFAGSTAFTRTRGLLINYASVFRDNYSKYVSRYTFEHIRPIIEEIEIYAIENFLGPDQFSRIKAGILADDLTDAELELLRRLQKAVAHFTIKEAIARMWVRIEGKNVVQSENSEPQSYERTASAKEAAAGLLLRTEEIHGDRMMKYVKDYLDDNLATFTDYSDYLDELAAAEEEESTTLTPDCTDPVWARYPCTCQNNLAGCTCGADTSKGIVRL
jgi:hypothetical protein